MFVYEKIAKHGGTRKEAEIMAIEITDLRTMLFWLIAIS